MPVAVWRQPRIQHEPKTEAGEQQADYENGEGH